LEDFKRRNIKLHLLDLGGDVVGNGVAKLVFTVLAAVAEAERDRTRERIADVKSDQRRRNRFLGGKRPFGFDVDPDGALIAIPAEQMAIDQMLTLRQSGASLRKIAEAVQASGVAISHETIRVVLKQQGEKVCNMLSI
jgi:putative DNA-invertase from lambdoid prophage Rac